MWFIFIKILALLAQSMVLDAFPSIIGSKHTLLRLLPGDTSSYVNHKPTSEETSLHQANDSLRNGPDFNNDHTNYKHHRVSPMDLFNSIKHFREFLISKHLNQKPSTEDNSAKPLRATRIRRDEPETNLTLAATVNNSSGQSTVLSKTEKPIQYDTKSILTWTRHYSTNHRIFRKKKQQSVSLAGATIGGIILLLVGAVVVYLLWRLKNKERSYEEAEQRMEPYKREDTDLESSIAQSSPV